MGYLVAIALCAGLSFSSQTFAYEEFAIGIPVGAAIFVLSSLLAFLLRGDHRITFVNFFRSVACCGTEILREEVRARLVDGVAGVALIGTVHDTDTG